MSLASYPRFSMASQVLVAGSAWWRRLQTLPHPDCSERVPAESALRKAESPSDCTVCRSGLSAGRAFHWCKAPGIVSAYGPVEAPSNPESDTASYGQAKAYYRHFATSVGGQLLQEKLRCKATAVAWAQTCKTGPYSSCSFEPFGETGVVWRHRRSSIKASRQLSWAK